MATQTSVLGLSKPAGNENALVSVLNSDMDLIDAEAGKVRGNIAATYSASSSYAVGDLCIYNGILYKCNTAIGSGGETWNASHWTQITIDGELTALNGKIEKLGQSTRESLNGENAIKTYLLNVANGMSNGESKLLRISNSDTNFQSTMPLGQTFEGYVYCSYKDSSSVYFVWTGYSANGNNVFFGYTGGTWSIQKLALESEITQYVKYVDITLSQKTINAGSNATWSAVDVSSSIPTGYTAIGVVPRYSGSSGNCVFTMANISSNKIDANVANISSSSQTPAPHVAIICIKG